MKKVALSLLAFVLVGALAVAQDAPTLKLSGYLNTGVKIVTNDGTQTSIYGDDADNAWGRFDLNGAYATDTNGVAWRLRTADNVTAPALKYAYAWSKFADGLVTVKAGRVDDGTFATAGDINADYSDTNSVLLIVTPVAGFSIGASAILSTGFGSDPSAFAVQAAYKAEKLVSVQAGLKVVDSKASEALVGLGVLAVDGLTLTADSNITVLNDFAAKGAAKSDLNLGYAVTDAFSVGLLTYVYTWGGDVKFTQSATASDKPLGYSIKPSVSYTVDPLISLGANVKYAKGPQGTPDATKDLGGVTAAAAKVVAAPIQANIDAYTAAVVSYATKGFTNDAAFVEVNPSVTFTLSPAAKIIAGVVYDASLDDKKLSYAGKSSQTAVKLDFRYNF